MNEECKKPSFKGGDNSHKNAVTLWKNTDSKKKSNLIFLIISAKPKQEVWFKIGENLSFQKYSPKAAPLKPLMLMLQRISEMEDVHRHMHKFFDAVARLIKMNV